MSPHDPGDAGADRVTPRQASPVTRRRFLALGLGGAAVAALRLAGFPVERPSRYAQHLERFGANLLWARDARLTLAQRVERHFHYLRLDPEGVRSFARDWERENGAVRRFRRPARDPFRQFLLSSDFFRNGADEMRTVRYVAYYDPYRNPCWNPCAPPTA